MPRIIPIRDLKNTAAVSQMCSESKEPVYITKKWLWRYGHYEHGSL